MQIEKRIRRVHGHGIRKGAFLDRSVPRAIFLLVLIVCVYGICLAGALYLGTCPVDYAVFQYAAKAVLNGESPYTVVITNANTGLSYGFYNPPWLLPFLFPLAFLSRPFGMAYLWCGAFVVYGGLLYKARARALPAALVLTSAPMVLDLYYGQINFLVWLGLLLPRNIGLLFLALKPQIGFGVGVYWLIDEWKCSGWKGVFRLLWPLCVFLLCSFLVYGLWPLAWERMVSGEELCVVWPYLVPVGVYLLWYSIKAQKQDAAILATPLLSPHVWTHSLVGWLLQLQDRLPWLCTMYVIFWIYELLHSVFKVIQ